MARKSLRLTAGLVAGWSSWLEAKTGEGVKKERGGAGARHWLPSVMRTLGGLMLGDSTSRGLQAMAHERSAGS